MTHKFLGHFKNGKSSPLNHGLQEKAGRGGGGKGHEEKHEQLNAWGQDEKTAKEVRGRLRDEKKSKRIHKLVKNAPEGSALRPWSYEKKKYI